MGYSITNDYLEIITETTNFTSPVYKEAANDSEQGTPKGLAYFKNFLTSIENLSKKSQVKDERISGSKGNIKNFSGYNDIETAIKFLNKNLSGVKDVKECVTVYDALCNWTSLYEQGYSDNVRLIQLEYENAVFMLVTTLSAILATNMDVVANGTEIRFKKKEAATHGVIQSTMKDLAKQLGDRNHKEYLDSLLKASEKPVTESMIFTEGLSVAGIAATFDLIKGIFSNSFRIAKGGVNVVKTLKKSLFGIVPLIRSIMYIRYKKKADTIVALEEQAAFIQMNIEQLQNMKYDDPAKKELIIRKQKATMEAYRKKAEKLRAQLMETEKDAAVAIKKENPQMKETSGDLVLESAAFMESTVKTKRRKFKRSRLSVSEIKNVRNDKMVEKLHKLGNFSSVNNQNVKKIDQELQKKVDSVVKEIMNDKRFIRDSIVLTPGTVIKEDKDKSRLLDTKIGGNIYWPKDKEYPTFGKEPMVCIAQLNFSKLPNIEGYPTKGLLQFFLSDMELWDVKVGNGVEVVYHPNPDINNAVDKVPIVLSEAKSIDFMRESGCYYPTAKTDKELINCEVEHPYIFDIFKDKVKDSGADTLIWDAIYDNFQPSWKTRIGGWPSYTQSEPRYVDKNTLQLLQLDSEAGMMWGDCGIAHFFIQKDDLEKLNFDNVIFTWDCY